MATAREKDINGYVRVKDNPISKVGVFPYLGSSLGRDYDPNKVYMVYRPEKELNNSETIESFKSIPWIDEHEMLGNSEEGLTPAEQKGVQGVTGENVYFDYPYLKANLNIFSQHLSGIIEDGKKELSPGYRCTYRKERGSFVGIDYEVVQENILGNHLATVREGRTGPDVAVMDHSFTFDSKDLVMDEKKTEGTGFDGAQLTTLKTLIASAVDEAMKKSKDMQKDEDMDKDKDMKDGKKPGMDMEEKGMKKSKDMEMEEDDDMENGKKKGEKGMDSADVAALQKQVKDLTSQLSSVKTAQDNAMDTKSVIRDMNQRNQLATNLSRFVGSFDHAEMTLQEVEKYGVEKLGLQAQDGMEGAVLNGYLHGRKPETSMPVHQTGFDSAAYVDPIDAHYNQ